MTNNNYILARWRDAITDPPDNDRPVPYYEKWTSGFVLLSAWIRDDGVWIDGSDDSKISTKPGDQWLDIAAIPGVPREAVQAAVDEMNRIAYMIGSNCEFLRGMELKRCQDLAFMKQFTGVTPTEGT